MATLQAEEIYTELIDDFMNIWFVKSWDDMELFVINREAILECETVTGYTGSYVTEYCGQDYSCGNSIEAIDFSPEKISITFNETGKEYLEIDSLTIEHSLSPETLEKIKEETEKIIAI